ncbi:MAG: sugar phosphate nucleotidyltransferase, partial [Pseudomonadota bacterium]
PRGTAGALADIAERETDPVLVMNGDILTRVSPRSLFEFHREEDAAATMAVRSLRVDIPFGVVEMSGHRMESISEKPAINHYVSAGIYVLSADALSLVPGDRAFDMPELLTAIHQRRAGSVACFPVPEYWTDIGRMDDLARARDEYSVTFGSD